MHNSRLYTFINFYLSSIQQGIQSAHIVSELFIQKFNRLQQEKLSDWANKDKTIIVCNGGTSFDLRQDYITVMQVCARLGDENYFPHAFFTEDHNALGQFEHGVTTGWGIIVPQYIWDTNLVLAHNPNMQRIGLSIQDVRNVTPNYYSHTDEAGYEWRFAEGSQEAKIIELIKSKGLAR